MRKGQLVTYKGLIPGVVLQGELVADEVLGFAQVAVGQDGPQGREIRLFSTAFLKAVL
jgi:hypothetical protein